MFFGFPLSTASPTPPVSVLRQLAADRDVAGLNSYLDSASRVGSPFSCISTGGCYDMGKYGWAVDTLPSPDGKSRYIVFSTPATCEDVGDLMFQVTPKGLHYIPEGQNWGAKILHNSLSVQFGLAQHMAYISDQSIVRREKGGLTSIRLGPNYEVHKLTVNGRTAKWTQSKGVILVQLGKGNSNVRMDYAGKVWLPTYSACVDTKSAMLSEDYWYPMIGRGPAPYTVSALVPKGWMAVGQGDLKSKKREGNQVRWTYEMDLPVVMYSLSAGPYREETLDEEGIQYRVWSASDSPESMKRALQYMPPIIQFYSRTFAKFPFKGFGLMVEPKIAATALEAYSFATYSHLPHGDAHEPSHTWWGGLINNTYLHSLWNESFADYSEGICAQHMAIGNDSERELAFITHPEVHFDHNAPPIATGGAFAGPAGSYLGYGKGSYVLFQLEQEMGYKELTACMRQWVQTHDRMMPGDWKEFENVVESRDGKKWQWFFDQWLNRSGVPDFEIASVAKSGASLKFHVHYYSNPYRMKVQYLTEDAAGHQSLRSFEIAAAADQDYTVPIGSHDVMVSFDPYRRLIRKIQNNEAPVSIDSDWRHYDRYSYGKVSQAFGDLQPVSKFPDDLAGKAVAVGLSHISDPAVVRAFRSAGFEIKGDSVTWHGTTVSLKDHCAEAVIPVKGGSMLLIAGTTFDRPDTGDADIALTDNLGRFLRGHTRPKTSGYWVFKLGI